ncbi:YybH family protein [Flavobacterium sp. '19STA2R22 D10 B1']|uniref:YybH family protein n=1 Tax=Flavobacterium aerium TaxID=3037261 RepID=UPI00278BBA6D|nr:nuclear transport factor 2 family protein [Flavobacterium sp. '19STA2R22 D10 B1']
MDYKILKEANFALTPEVQEAIQFVSTYNSYLKKGSLPELMSVFTEDSVLVPENQKAISGLKNIEAVYGELVKVIRFNEGNLFNIIDAYTVGDLAYVRSQESTGSVTEIESGKTTAPKFREFWLLKRNKEGKWKIATYLYGLAPQKDTDLADAVVW